MPAIRPPWFDFRNPDYPRVFAERIERLKRIRADPSSVPYMLQYYRDNPAQLIMDWGCTADPRNVERDLPAVVPFMLFDRQIEWIDWIVENWRAGEPGITEKSRDMGVSWLAIALSCTLSITRHDMVIGFGSRKEEYVDKIGAPKTLFHKARMFLKLGDGSVANQAATYTSNGISRNYQLLVEMYRSSWIVANAVDAVAEDMTRAGIDLMGITPEEEARMQRALTRMGLWQAKTSGLKWGRLLGGSAEVMMVRGQALASPLLLDRVDKDQFEGLMVFDRRELIPDSNARIVGGMDAGLPEYYDVAELGLRIHHSRVIRNVGRELPRMS
jgi:hypothetical protein